MYSFIQCKRNLNTHGTVSIYSWRKEGVRYAHGQVLVNTSGCDKWMGVKMSPKSVTYFMDSPLLPIYRLAWYGLIGLLADWCANENDSQSPAQTDVAGRHLLNTKYFLAVKRNFEVSNCLSGLVGFAETAGSWLSRALSIVNHGGVPPHSDWNPDLNYLLEICMAWFGICLDLCSGSVCEWQVKLQHILLARFSAHA